MNLQENLAKMSRDELVKFADTQGVQVHWKAKPETIIKQIMDHVAHPPVPKLEAIDTRLIAAKEAIFNTPEQIEDMLTKIRETKPEFKSIYSDNNTVVTFSYKGAEECHNLSVPIHWLRERARLVGRGRIAPLGRPEFESMNTATGKNAYTNTVLAG